MKNKTHSREDKIIALRKAYERNNNHNNKS